MTEGRQPFTAEIKTLAKGPSTYDPLENGIRAHRTAGGDVSLPLAITVKRDSRHFSLSDRRMKP
jgi:hypothetical protein